MDSFSVVDVWLLSATNPPIYFMVNWLFHKLTLYYYPVDDVNGGWYGRLFAYI